MTRRWRWGMVVGGLGLQVRGGKCLDDLFVEKALSPLRSKTLARWPCVLNHLRLIGGSVDKVSIFF
jgi:hypothetical protein